MTYARQYPKFWLAYFVLSVVVLAGNAVAAAASLLEPGSPGRLLGLLLGVIGAWPLYGFVRQRRFNPRWLWQVVFVVTAMATILVVAICLHLAFTNGAAVPVAIAAAFVVLSGP